MDLDILKSFFNDPEKVFKQFDDKFDSLMKQVNSVGNKDLSRECLDLITRSKRGELTPEEGEKITQDIKNKYADRD